MGQYAARTSNQATLGIPCRPCVPGLAVANLWQLVLGRPADTGDGDLEQQLNVSIFVNFINYYVLS
jgi:hypothetical protein